MKPLQSCQIETPIGPMLAVANDEALYLLEFMDKRKLASELKRLEKAFNSPITPGKTAPLQSIEHELELYFQGKLKEFTTPIAFLGTPFQLKAWKELQNIPYGQTRSYSQQAINIGRPTARRAVAHSNSNNQLSIIVPCHRVIAANGTLAGYAGGVPRKQWLLELEKTTEAGEAFASKSEK